MAGYLLHLGAVVTCFDGGPSQPQQTNSCVQVSGQPTVLQSTQYMVPACPLASTSSPPCVSAIWTSATTKVTSNGQPLVISSGDSKSTPNLTALKVVTYQTLVSAT